MKTLATVILACILLQTVALAHPADGYTPKPLQKGFGTEWVGYDPKLGGGDIVFVRPFPDPATLSDTEKYMISGSAGSSYGNPLDAWYISVVQAVAFYDQRFGSIPDTFDPFMLGRMMPEPQNVDADRADLYRNPITGAWPKLKAEKFSPGDMYIRKLADPEIRKIAAVDPVLNQIYFEGSHQDPQSGEDAEASMATGIYYVRVYGSKGIIITTIWFCWEESK